MYKLIAFIVVSAGIFFLSFKSLRRVRSHGFFRFFAFESILGLILLNANYWFRDPFSSLQVVSWLLLLGSIFMAVHGFYLLRQIGGASQKIEDTTILVKQGAYKYIRHPLYSSLLLFGLGAFLKNLSVIAGILALANIIFLVATARVEETENVGKFGAEYTTYKKMTRMFIPFLF